MKTLKITQIKPNPAGKDRQRGTTTASQLAGEWVDFRNDGNSSADLAAVDLYHLAYTPGEAQPHWDKVTAFTKGTLLSGQTVRVHSGSGPLSEVRAEDIGGADYHVFTGRDYVWNNRQGDKPTLFDRSSGKNIDQASYDPNPPEGEVLVRSGDKLVPARVPAYR